MDIERTMDFILEQQAKAETQLAAIRNLIHAGMEVVLKHGEAIQEIDRKITQLAAAQLVTEEKLQGLIDSLKRNGGGGKR